MITFATEAPAEAGAREALLDRVMGPARRLKPSERLRVGRKPADGLALVARDGSRLVGSVRLWNIDAAGKPALLLGPLAVDPAEAGSGVGSGLMRLAIARATMIGHRSIILVGDPEYYERFGFTAEPTAGLVMPAPVERRRFLGVELVSQALAEANGRIVATGRAPSGGRTDGRLDRSRDGTTGLATAARAFLTRPRVILFSENGGRTIGRSAHEPRQHLSRHRDGGLRYWVVVVACPGGCRDNVQEQDFVRQRWTSGDEDGAWVKRVKDQYGSAWASFGLAKEKRYSSQSFVFQTLYSVTAYPCRRT